MNNIEFKLENMHLHKLFTIDQLQTIENYQRSSEKGKLKFMTHGVHQLMAFEDLQRLPKIDRLKIRVVDVQTGQSWVTNYRTILKKFG